MKYWWSPTKTPYNIEKHCKQFFFHPSKKLTMFFVVYIRAVEIIVVLLLQRYSVASEGRGCR